VTLLIVTVTLLIDTMTLLIDTMTLLIVTMTLLIDTMTLLIDTMTLLIDTVTLLIDTVTLLIDTVTLLIVTVTLLIDTVTLLIDTVTLLIDTMTLLIVTMTLLIVTVTLLIVSAGLVSGFETNRRMKTGHQIKIRKAESGKPRPETGDLNQGAGTQWRKSPSATGARRDCIYIYGAGGQSARGLAHSRTLARVLRPSWARSVLECVRPSAALERVTDFNQQPRCRFRPSLGPSVRSLVKSEHLSKHCQRRGCESLSGISASLPKRQRTGALQDAGASFTTIVGAKRLGVRAALRRFSIKHQNNLSLFRACVNV